MNLYLIQPNESLWSDKANKGDNPWEPWYDKCFGMVIRAESEEDARKLADGEDGDENRSGQYPWLHEKYSTCEVISSDGDAKVILKDVHWA